MRQIVSFSGFNYFRVFTRRLLALIGMEVRRDIEQALEGVVTPHPLRSLIPLESIKAVSLSLVLE
jgi:hypothetical protein